MASAPERTSSDRAPRAPHRILGFVDVLGGLLLLGGVWGALPARWWPIDSLGTALGLLFVGAGVGLLLGTSWARRVGIVVGAVSLFSGLSLVTGLFLAASHIVGLYGPVGQGGALLLFIVALLILPYLVFLPAAQLFALARADTRARP